MRSSPDLVAEMRDLLWWATAWSLCMECAEVGHHSDLFQTSQICKVFLLQASCHCWRGGNCKVRHRHCLTKQTLISFFVRGTISFPCALLFKSLLLVHFSITNFLVFYWKLGLDPNSMQINLIHPRPRLSLTQFERSQAQQLSKISKGVDISRSGQHAGLTKIKGRYFFLRYWNHLKSDFISVFASVFVESRST